MILILLEIDAVCSRKVTKIHDFDSFNLLEDSWNILADKMGNPLLRHECHSAMIKAHPKRSRLFIIVVWMDAKICAIAPLHLRWQFGAKWLDFITHELHEPSGFLYADEMALQALVDEILATKLPVRLNRLSADSAELRCFQKLGRKRSVLYQTHGGSILRVPLSGDFDLVEKKISGDHRRHLRRHRRRAESQGRVEFVAVAPEASNIDNYLDEFFRIEASGWKGRGGSAIVSDPQREAFFRSYGKEAAKRGMLRLFLMKIGQDTVAARFAIVYANRLWELKIGYDERWGSCAPGILLTHETLRYACKEKLIAHEFLGMSARWERIWRHEEHHCQTLRCYPFAMASLFSLCVEGVQLTQATISRNAIARIRATGKTTINSWGEAALGRLNAGILGQDWLFLVA
jgi:CelD/BcsL family acetyltransferase involved in cellulose biosynthesis